MRRNQKIKEKQTKIENDLREQRQLANNPLRKKVTPTNHTSLLNNYEQRVNEHRQALEEREQLRQCIEDLKTEDCTFKP